MEVLQDILSVLTNEMGYEDTQLDVVGTRMKDNESIIYNHLRHASYRDEDDIAQDCECVHASEPKYRYYKRRVRKKLLQEILHHAPAYHKSAPYQRAYYECQQLFAVYNTLKGLEKRKLFHRLGKQLLEKSRKYHFNLIRYEVCVSFALHYSSKEGNVELANQYFEESNTIHEVLRYEKLAKWYYSQVLSHFVHDKSNKPEVVAKAKKYVASLQSYADLHLPSTQFYQYFYVLKVLLCEAEGEYTTALESARQGLKHFTELDINLPVVKGIFLRNITNCLLQLSYYTEAKQSIQAGIQYQTIGSTNWFLAMRLQLQISLHQQDYALAWDHYVEMISHNSYTTLADTKKNLYELFGSYVAFLHLIGKIDQPKMKGFAKLKRQKDVPVFNNDKRGMLIPTIVIQLLFHIYHRKYDDIEQRLYALKAYCTTHLRVSSPNYRSNCFIKMLLTIPLSNFNPIATRRNANKFVKRLSSIPFAISKQPAEVEIIPYEHLWEIVLEHLSTPKRKRKYAMDKSLFKF